MADVDALLRDEDDAPTKDVDALLADDEPTPPAQVTKPDRVPTEADRKQVAEYFKGEADLPWYKRAARGAIDPILGVGQLEQNIIPDAVLNAGRKLTDPLVNAIAGGTPRDTSKTSTDEFNSMVRKDEAAYQGERANAGQEGIDLARIGGTLANPLSWLAAVKGGTTVAAALRAGAQTGALQALMQPITSDGNFIYNKAIQGTLGAAFGGTLGAAFGMLAPVFAKGRELVGKTFAAATPQAQAAAATHVVDDAVRAAGVDPARMDPRTYGAIREEVLDAYKAGVNPDPTVMTNRADAAALPVPMKLLRGEASGDPALYSWEVNTAKRQGVGDELLEHKDGNNRALIENLNQLGAKSAPSTFDTSGQAITKLQEIDDTLSKAVTDAYDKVKNSAGQSAAMDGRGFARNAREALKNGGMGLEDFLPTPFRNTLNAIELGNAPLTVNTAQQLDKQLYAEMAASTNGNVRSAISAMRNALNGAGLSDQLGEDSMKLYQAAKGLHAKRMGLIDANPGYKAVVDGKAQPDSFWKTFIAGAPTAQIASLKEMLGPDLVKTIQATTVRQLKKQAIGTASDERGDFSQAAYNNMIHDEVMGPRLREIFREDPEKLQQIYRVGRVAENVKRFPSNHRVNTSGTAAEVENIVKEHIKGVASQGILGMLGPPGKFIGGLVNTSREANERAAERLAVRQSANPGVTRAPLPPKPPSQTVARISDLLSRGAGAATPQDEE